MRTYSERLKTTHLGFGALAPHSTRLTGPDGREFCSDGGCDGACSLPALMLDDCKAQCSAVACGHLWQLPKVAWRGNVVDYRDLEDVHIAHEMGLLYF